MPCPRKIHDWRCKARCTHPDVLKNRRRVLKHLYRARRWSPTVMVPPDLVEAFIRPRVAAAGKFSRPRPTLSLRRGSLTVNRARLDNRRGAHRQPGLELFGEVYYALLPATVWRREVFKRWDSAATKRSRRRASRAALRSPWEFYRYLHSIPSGKNPEAWRLFADRYLVRPSPSLRRIVEDDPQAAGRVAAVLGRFSRSGGGGRPRYRTPETLAIAITAAALQKDPKSVERRVDLSSAPREVSLVPRPQK